MAHVRILEDDVELTEPYMIEGLPGVGLVGKIVADHLIDALEMTQYANVHCSGLPSVARYEEGDPTLSTPLRLYANETGDLLVLQSDIPVSPDAATEIANCIQGWFDEEEVTPVYLSGIPREKDAEPPELYGICAGDGGRLLSDVGIGDPTETGIVTGPTGALLAHAIENDTTAVGFVVESDPQFPDPEAARIVITEGIEPLTGREFPVDDLVDSASEIRTAKEQLAQQMQSGGEESTQVQPLRMYQ
ncbi:Archaeal enzyme of ATP-grasp superfamily [Halalkaliarchaeum sp. AArc-CO]|uniref:proteasome assembly chaperone family protein n=1 Tax=unclassified Halalkaliarchaeum TaxID=2678344 RepID=UPI00217E28AE|nr:MULTISPECIES: PAC2 family protein [unclassified Halalkaliarchaeum]MDR5671878.1 PAC2 family protein [Halalkaliarchaeum sp. AArc-GB]UWG51383.1 Archaeal enzyme of ATP-grasp superfamily [Halalkaliarchaeum sp. AArc-CO]